MTAEPTTMERLVTATTKTSTCPSIVATLACTLGLGTTGVLGFGALASGASSRSGVRKGEFEAVLNIRSASVLTCWPRALISTIKALHLPVRSLSLMLSSVSAALNRSFSIVTCESPAKD